MKDLPLKGIRVADFGQILAMPFATQMLGWLGAEVILVESRERLTLRTWPPFAEAIPGVNRSGGFNTVNNNKLSCTLNLRSEEGQRLAHRLITISDVVVENYSIGTMEKLGLGYETVRQLRPDVIYVSLSAFGRTGPMKDSVGFHSAVNLFSGVAAATGYPGGKPRILGSMLPDLLSGSYCALATLEALYHRFKTGEGQYVEVAMSEVFTNLIPEAVMDYTLNGQEANRVGNRDKSKAPHNVYLCKGDQKWLAISIDSDSQWNAFCHVIGQPEWTDDPRFVDAASRWENQEALDSLIESWTKGKEPNEVMAALQEVGVPAASVLDSREVLEDSHLVERGFVTQVDHPETGRRPMGTLSWSMNGERPDNIRHAPLLGEDNHYVLGQLLDLPEDEIQRLMKAGVIA